MKLWRRNVTQLPMYRIPEAFLVTGKYYPSDRYPARAVPFWQIMIPLPVWDWEFKVEYMEWKFGRKWFVKRKAGTRSQTLVSVLHPRYGEYYER